jgi:hypothetical protein
LENSACPCSAEKNECLHHESEIDGETEVSTNSQLQL